MANEKIMILRAMSESDIKSLGGGYILRKKYKYWVGLFIISVGWFPAVQYLLTNSTVVNVISILPFLCVLIAFLYTYNKAGNALWRKVRAQWAKDKDQPIKLGF